MRSGEFHTTYRADMAIFDTARARHILAAFLVVLFALPLFGSSYWLDVLETLSSQAECVVDDRAEIHARQGIEVMRALDSVLETSSSPRLRARATMAVTMAFPSGSSFMPFTKERSILRVWMGKRWR